MKEDFSPIDGIILAFLQGNITLNEKELLKGWINESPGNRTYFKQLFAVWKTAEIENYKTDDIEKAYRLTQLRINEVKGLGVERKGSFSKSLILNYGKWAAVIIISLSVGIFLRHGLTGSSVPIFSNKNYSEINVPLGSKSSIHLQDGTEVFLNAGSRLTYKNNFGLKLREVDLVGEAYFIIARNPSKPFIVHTSNANIKALGTEFNVKAYAEDDVVETILVKGSVEVVKIAASKGILNKNTEESILLKPGQKAKVYRETVIAGTHVEDSKTANANKKKDEVHYIKNKHVIKLEPSDPQIETSWKENLWIIKGENMGDLAVILSRRFNVKIRISDYDLLQYKFSGTIQNETLEQVFKIIGLTIPISYTIDKGLVNVTIDRSLEQKYKKAY